MPISPDDLLKPRKRVFTRPKRRWGPISVLLSVASAAALAVAYGSFAGYLWPQGWFMLAVGVLGAVALPLLLVRRVRGRGPRLFALIDVVAALVVFALMGGPTDRALVAQGSEPFRSVGRLLGGSDAAQRGDELGRGFVGLLRYLTVVPDAEPEPAPSDADPVDAPEADAPTPTETDSEAPAAAAPSPDDAPAADDGSSDEAAAALAARQTGDDRAAALQHAVRDRAQPAGSGTYNVLGGSKTDTISIPISGQTGTFTVGALVNGRVPAEFTFDTGADLTAITPTLARRLGLDPDASTERRRLLTPGGPIEAPVVRVASIGIDGATVVDLDVVVCARCPGNLLGRDFQRHFRVEIDGRAGLLRLHRR